MSTKTSTNISTTTNLRTGQITSFKTTSKTSSPTNVGKGGLSAVGRLGMIAITILAVSVGSAVDQFSTSDLIETNPNYQVNNDFIPIEDPLNNINYVQYGSEVFDNIVAFTQGFSDMGMTAKNLWDKIVTFFEADSTETATNFLVDYNRLLTNITTAQDKYDLLSASDKVVYAQFYDGIQWFVKWLYYSPAELTA